MYKFLFSDGEDVCLYEDGKIVKRHSKFIENYKNACASVERARTWKQSGEGAKFRGDVRYEAEGESAMCTINGVWFTSKDNEIVYSFTVDQSSGVYKIDFSDEKAPEIHVVNSVDYRFSGGCCDAVTDILVTEISRNYCNSDIAVLDLKSGEYKTVTDGDTMDGDPFISPDDADAVYFSSRGVGRTLNGDFAGFSPASVCKLNISALEVEEILSSDKYNYFKPIVSGGKLYVLRTPSKDKKPNPLLEIILIPFRIIQALVNFINVFVTAFTGKSLASGGSNPAKGRKYDSREQFVKGNLINVDKQLKTNARKDKDGYGFIPLSWQIIEAESGKVIKSGIADYDITDDGTFIATNGKRIFAVKDGKSVKLCDTERCLTVSCRHGSGKSSDLFAI